MTDNAHWFVLRAVFSQELKVRDKLRSLGLRSYVPMCWRMENTRGHKIRKLVPAITELVFVYGEEEKIGEFKSRLKETVYWMMTFLDGQREKLIVPDKAMNDFIRITEQSERSVTFFRPDEIRLNKGDKILIHGGPFDGVEGILQKVKGKREKQILVSIPQIVTAAVSIRPEMVELISSKASKSSDPAKDAKELIRLSEQMLTAAPDKECQENEWNILYNEICRLHESLKLLKGYLPRLEGEMALALLMAEAALGQSISQQTLQRYDIAMAKLRDGSQLKIRMQEVKQQFFGVFCSNSKKKS